MADWAHDWTDERIAELERKFEATYAQAAKEMREKLDTYLEGYGDRLDQWKADVASGAATQEQYDAWLKGQSMRREYLIDMTNALAEDAADTDQLAADYINDELPSVFTENANWTAFQIEKHYGTAHSFALYDRDTVRRIMGMTEHDQIMHEVIPVGPPNTPLQSLRVHPERVKDVKWNRQKFTASIVQSILQGESIPNTAKRLERVLSMDRGMATRAARTAMTSAENAGRVDSYRRAVDMGLQVEQRWMATLDLRTRQSHRELDKQHVPVGQYFVVPSNGHKLRFPADPAADGSETWNCFVGETLVTTDSPIEASYRHEYKGKLVTIDTASGIHFTCTPNHPILTTNGWVAAELLHDGDNLLITGRVNSHGTNGNPDVDHVFPSMKAIHESLGVSSAKRVCGVSVNFHGDVATSNVEVVAKKSLLRLCVNACRHEGIVKLFLKPSDALDLGKGTPVKGLRRVMIAASRFVSGLRVCASFLWGHGSHADVHGLRAAARRDSSVTEYAIDNLPAETMVRSELLRGLSRQVFVDKVIDVKVSSTRGTQVYNLQTGSGYYFANERDNGKFIIAKNCRCTLVAWFPDSVEDVDRWSRLPKGMTYDDWKKMKEADDG